MKIDQTAPVADMSPQAIDRRLQEFFDLWQMAVSLKNARLIGKWSDLVDEPVNYIAQSDREKHQVTASTQTY